ncbi:hypothetical protein D0862_08624 [Hortaea werneckii]|uniref:G-protein coupled receptors family 2 profile 2 domain-containing protein n=1 Tax=Hortaea werneckii TaxID=91943 RepID=A0A3M7G561_HORWE|nr:hypothetical protein D0862_08624 [Hortaea werneckii]
MWIFIRALSMNLQICWDIVPGKKFFYAAQAFGWGIPAVLFAASLTATGLSYHFGNACLLNHKNSMADFWGPLLGIAGAAGLLQLATFGYCIHVYLKNLWSDQSQESSAASGSGLPSYNSSEFVSLDARQKDLERSNSMNGLLRYDHVRGHQSTTFEMQQPGMKTLELETFDADSKSPTVLSSPEDAYQTPLQHPYNSPVLTSDSRGNSPSLDAIGRSRMMASTNGSQMTPDPSIGLTSPNPTYNGLNVQQQSQDYFSQYQRRAYSRQDSSDSLTGERQQSGPHHRSLSQERRYQPPSASFSAPKTPSRQSSVRSAIFAETRDAYGRGGLGLNPPSEAGESQEDLTHSHARRVFDRR